MPNITPARHRVLDSLPRRLKLSYPHAQQLVTLGLATWGDVVTHGEALLSPTEEGLKLQTPKVEPTALLHLREKAREIIAKLRSEGLNGVRFDRCRVNEDKIEDYASEMDAEQYAAWCRDYACFALEPDFEPFFDGSDSEYVDHHFDRDGFFRDVVKHIQDQFGPGVIVKYREGCAEGEIYREAQPDFTIVVEEGATHVTAYRQRTDVMSLERTDGSYSTVVAGDCFGVPMLKLDADGLDSAIRAIRRTARDHVGHEGRVVLYDGGTTKGLCVHLTDGKLRELSLSPKFVETSPPPAMATVDPFEAKPATDLADLLYRFARHVRNTDKLDPGPWGVKGMDLLADLRGIDAEKYDRLVKAPAPSPISPA